MPARNVAAYDGLSRSSAAQHRSESASRRHRRASSVPKNRRARRRDTRGPNHYAASISTARNIGSPRSRWHEPRSRQQKMRRAIARDVIACASNRRENAICLARLPMSPGPKFADGSGQERRGAAAQIGGGYIGNVTTPEASLSREGICGSVDSRGSLAGRNRNLALQLRGSAGLAPAFPTRISRHTTRLPRQVNRRLEADQRFGIWNLTRGGGVGCSNMAASRRENRENGSVDLRHTWVAGAADILFGCQALSSGKRDCELAGFDVAAVSRIGSA